MNIEYEKESKTSFEDVARGEVFKYDTEIYMKVDSTDENGTELGVNALNLCTAELHCIPSYSEVKILDATLKISN